MPEVLLVRAAEAQDKDADALADLGITAVADPYLTVRPCRDDQARDRAHLVISSIADEAGWLLVTSQAAVRALVELGGSDALAAALRQGQARGLRVAGVGESTRRALNQAGAPEVLVPGTATAEGLVDLLAGEAASTAILPQGNQALTTLADGLRGKGWTITEQVVYETATVDRRPVSADRLARGGFAVVVLRSPSAARAVAEFVPVLPGGTVAICGGPTTAAEARRLGIGTVIVSASPSASGVAEAVASHLAAQQQ